jgi:hypothetical protein
VTSSVFYCSKCDDIAVDFVFDEIAQTQDEAQRMHWATYKCREPLVDLVAVYEEVKDRCMRCGCNRKHHSKNSGGVEWCWLCYSMHDWRTLKALEAEK